MKKLNELEKIKYNTDAQGAIDITQYTSQSLCIYGAAGTGKSTLIEIMQQCLDKSVTTLAATSNGAKIIKGKSIHQFFKIPFNMQVIDEERLSCIKLSSSSRDSILNSQVVVIDEISLISSGLLDIIDYRLREVKKVDLPFGGMQMVFIGDPFQSPPIIDEPSKYPSTYKSVNFFDAYSFKSLKPITLELTQQYKFHNKSHLNIINDMRCGKDINKSLELLNKRVKRIKDDFTISLAKSNNAVDIINQTNLSRIDKEVCNFEKLVATVDLSGKEVVEYKKLSLKEGAQVMFLQDDILKRYKYGTLAKVLEINGCEVRLETESGVILWINIDIDNGKRSKIFYTKDGKKLTTTNKSYFQYPIKLAWAITIYQSQGLTFNKVHLCNKADLSSAGLLYTAISRCRNLNGLTLQSKILDYNRIIKSEVSRYYDEIDDSAAGDLLEDIYFNISEDKFVCVRDLDAKNAA